MRLGLTALALTDHDGFYGVVRFAEAARVHGLPTVFGSELPWMRHPLRISPWGARTGTPDPSATHLVVLAADPIGYARLGTAIAESQLAGEKGPPGSHQTVWPNWPARIHAGRPHRLSKGAVPAALAADGPMAARRALDDLVDRFGPQRVVVELWDHGHPSDVERNDALATLAAKAAVGLVVTNNVHYHRPTRRRLATTMAAVRARRPWRNWTGGSQRPGDGPPAFGC
ncbi:MAG: hypothetical protein Ct9H300mP12_01890 [Acidimicrobiales bacterium]|nr:MAG: hypothetical protein Ct9H300mP12_01890 [Acidimicrobiales bacterium]